MLKNFRRSTIATGLACVLTLVATATPVEAVACNTAGCWAGVVKYVRIDGSARIWFVVEGSPALNNLVPQDGCTVQSIWTGQAEPGLYIRPGDSRALELYTMLPSAFSSGQKVSFGPIKDPATGWCALNNLDISP